MSTTTKPIAVPTNGRVSLFDETYLTTNVRGRMHDVVGTGAEIGAPAPVGGLPKPRMQRLHTAPVTKPEQPFTPGGMALQQATTQLPQQLLGLPSTSRTPEEQRLWKKYPAGYITLYDGTHADLRTVSKPATPAQLTQFHMEQVHTPRPPTEVMLATKEVYVARAKKGATDGTVASTVLPTVF